ncbi:unnamed protein product [Caenorhabditis bovis]|uniref:G-protein coupled receptors family 1 profile domain-containing protein n=1 Tax=Caenorhabditis bovis TaxID=2654633 RepID=A0A8S1EIT3_9PELO|nr:unnamed protein product [Caenorhabditis bovis]
MSSTMDQAEGAYLNLQELRVRCNLYIVCGIFVIIPNSICCLVFNSTKEFRQRFSFFTMLIIGDITNGLSFILSGIGRLTLLDSRDFFNPAESFDCLTKHLWPIFLLLGGQLPATFTILLTVERVLAVSRPSWYRVQWTHSKRFHLTVLALLFCATLNVIALLVALWAPFKNPDQICAVMNSTGIIYGTVHYIWIAFSYFIAFAITSYLFFRSFKSKFLNVVERRKQISVLCLSGIGVLLVSIPNIVLVVDEFRTGHFDVLFVGVTYCLYGIQSALNFPVFYFFRLEFRRRLHDIFSFRKRRTSNFQANSAPTSRVANARTTKTS